MADLSSLNGISSLYGGADDEKHSDAGWEWESAKAGYKSGLWAIPAALGSDYAQERFLANKDRSEYASSMSESPKSLEEVLQRQESGDYGMDVGGKLGYLRNLAIGSVPYAAEFVGTGFGLGALGKRAATGVAERVAAGAIERAVATGASRETALAAGDAAVNSAFRTAGGVVGSYPSAVGDVLGNQYDQSGEFDIGSAAALGVPYAALNAVGIEGALTRGLGGRLAGGRLANAVAQGGKLAISEGVGETGQEVSNQVGRYAVDNSYDPFGEQARKAYLESFAGGALLGGLPGGAVGALQKRPLDSGSDLLTGRNPAREAFDRAVAADILQQRRAAPESNPNPIQVTPSGDALIDPVQVQAYQNFGQNMQAPQANPAQAQQDQLAQIQQAIAPKYGTITPIMGTDGPTGFQFGGNTYNSQEALTKDLIKLHEQELQKPAHILGAEQALAEAFHEVYGRAPTIKEVKKWMTSEKQGNIRVANSAQNVIDRVTRQLSEVETKKGNDALANREMYAVWLSKLTGQPVSQNVQTAPAVQTTQQGAANGQVVQGQAPTQTQVNASEPQQLAPQAAQAEATQTTPIQRRSARSVARAIDELGQKTKSKELKRATSRLYNELMTQGTDAQIDEAEALLSQHVKHPVAKEATQAAELPKTAPETKLEQEARQAWDDDTMEGDPKFDDLPVESKQEWTLAVANNATSVELMNTLIERGVRPEANPATKTEIIKSIFTKVFGERNADIMMLAREEDLSQEEIGKKFNLSRAAVQKVIAKLSSPEAGKQLVAAAKELGLADDAIKTLLRSQESGIEGASDNLVLGDSADEGGIQLAEESAFAEVPTGDESSLDKNDVFGSEGSKPGMSIIDSAGESKAKIDVRTLSEKYAKALEAGKIEEANTILAKIQEGMDKIDAMTEARDKAYDEGDTETGDAIEERLAVLRDQFMVATGAEQTKASFRTEQFAVSFKALMSHPAIAKGVEQLKASGLGDLVNKVSMWTVYASNNKGEGAYVTQDEYGYTVAFNITALDAEGSRADHYVRHELGHVMDDALTSRIYSKAKELSIRMMNGKPSFLGAVARELHSLYQKGDQMWRDHFAYPFDPSHFVLEEGQKVTAADMAIETFAQLVSAYTDPKMGVQLKADAPLASAFMEKVLNEYRSSRTSEAAERGNAQDGSRRESSGVQANSDNANAGKSRVYASAKRGNNQQPNGSAAQTRQGVVERKLAKLPEPVRGPVQQLLDNFFNAVKKGVYGFAFTKDLVDMAAKVLPSSVNYVRLMERKGAVARAHENTVDNIVRDYEALPAHERGIGANSVNRFIHDSTRSGKWGYKIKQDANITLDPELEARFKNFSGPAKEVIKSVFKHGYDTLQQKKQLVRAEINAEFDGILASTTDAKARRELEAQRRARLKQFDSLMSIEANKPYAPLKRFGKYVTVGMSKDYLEAERNKDFKLLEKMQSDENHYYVQFADTIGEAKQMRDQIANDFEYAEAFEKNAAREALYGGQEMFTAFQRLKALVVEQFGDNKAENKSLQAINRMVSDLYLSTLSEASARKSESRRRKVAGADLDMMRAFATQGRADAHFIGSLLYSSEVNQSLEDMMQQSKERTPGREDRARLMNEFLLRHATGMDYRETRVQDAIQRATSLYMLAFSPSYYLQNLTQTPMMSMPVIAGRHGYAAASSAISSAYGDLAPMLKGSGIARRMNFENAPDDVKGVVEELVKRGVLDIGMDQDLGSFRSGGEGMTSRFANKLDRFLRGLPQKVEAINRVSTAVAAYRLELKRNNGDQQKAIDYAEQIINTTHGDYSGFNSPRYMTQMPFGKVLFQFRKFQIIQLSLMVRLANDAFRNSSPDERWAAKKALGYLVGQTALVGGVMGLPGFAAIAWAMGLFFGDDDTPDNPELTLRQMIGDKDLADLILKGTPTAVGIDLSGKLGMGQMLSILPFSDIDLSSRSGVEKTMTAMMGPFFGGVLPRMADAVGYMHNGDYFKALETAVPIGVGNALKAYRLGEEGMTNKMGDEVMSAEEFTFAKQMAVALGIPLADVTHKNFVQKAQIQYDEFFKDQSANIKHRYVKAARAGEPTGELLKEWNQLQDVRARVGYTRQKASELLKAPMAQVKREAGATGGVLTTRANKGFVKSNAGI